MNRVLQNIRFVNKLDSDLLASGVKRASQKLTELNGLQCTFSGSFHVVKSYATSSVSETADDATNDEGDFFNDEQGGRSEEEILALRNKSRLYVHHQRLVQGQVPHPEPTHWAHHTVRYKRKMYGTYGEASGVNPGLMWPTHEDLQDRLEYESVAYPFTLQEMVAKRKEMRRQEQEEFDRRTKELEKNMASLEKYKQQLRDKIAAKEKEIATAKAKREALMEEVRRHFGYTIDSRDEKFQALLEEKEKAQRKAIKEAKKNERQKQQMAKLVESMKTSEIPSLKATKQKQTDLEIPTMGPADTTPKTES